MKFAAILSLVLLSACMGSNNGAGTGLIITPAPWIGTNP